MSGLSRRQFLAALAGVAAVWALPFEQLGNVTSSRALATEAPTTLLQTIRMGGVTKGKYRKLVAAAGEAYQTRVDLLGAAANSARMSSRRSLLYIGHLSDIHIMDAQSPARLEPLLAQSQSLWGGAFRPQDLLTTQVAAEMVKSISSMRISPVTGAPLAAAFVTGDSADMLSSLETRWYVDIMDGTEIVPNSGATGVYEGVQGWDETFWAYHPENPNSDWFGEYGFPQVTGLLEAAVTQRVASGGMPVPWYGVYGNHDSTFYGTFGVPAGLKELAIGDRKFFDWKALGIDYIGDWATDTSAFARTLNTAIRNNGVHLGSKAVTADPARKLLEQQDFMKAHFETSTNPGPIGHGFTQDNLDTGKTYWSADVNNMVRFFGLDTCNQVVGADGALPEGQFLWLKAELEKTQAEEKLAVILSHHNSFTLENAAELATAPQRLVHADEFIAMLQSFPVVVAWLNGHTHNNTITAHKKTGGGGFWEITTASCIDFPQQQQMVEFVDNRDGTLSIFTTVVDHAADIAPSGTLTQSDLASWSRQLAANNWIDGPALRIGSELDRNTELLLPAPFDLSRFSDAEVERQQISNHARLMAWEAGWPA